MNKTAVVMAWREGENDLQATIDAAAASVRKRDMVFPVEDKTCAGPGRTRHRGIVAARDAGADVVIVVDAHMRFDGKVLSDMARQVRKDGGLYCALCHHNAACSFDAKHPSGSEYMAGAYIAYKGEDGNGRQALLWKWAPERTPGPRACVGGACYAFPVAWYFEVGTPLNALPGWGGDEEALSISAWYSGHMPMVFDGHVAHRWRERAPWTLTAPEVQAIRKGSRAAIIHAVVQNDGDTLDLLAWQKCQPSEAAEAEHWRMALLKQPRGWDGYKAEVLGMAKRERQTNLTTTMPGVACPHCHARHDPKRLDVTHTYSNGNRRHICPACSRPFISIFSATA